MRCLIFTISLMLVLASSTASAQAAPAATGGGLGLILPAIILLGIVFGLGKLLGKFFKHDYGAAKFVGALISFVGWVLVVVGVIGAVWGIGATLDITQGGYTPMAAMTGAAAVFSLQFALFGLFMAGAGQHFRAVADSASHTAEMLALMKSGKA